MTWNHDRGFGFISPEAGGPDVFVHISALPRGEAEPRVGERLRFEQQVAPDGRLRAAQAKRIGAAPRRIDPGAWSASRHWSMGYLAVGVFIVLFVCIAALWSIPPWVGLLYIGASIVSFVAYAADKSAARDGRWRIAESSLIALGVVGGWPGAVIAQRRLRHKTRKASFQVAFWGSVLLNVVAFVLLSYPGVPEQIAELVPFGRG